MGSKNERAGIRGLRAKTVKVRERIARGHSYDQIISAHPTMTYRDIFDAAAEVLAAEVRLAGGRQSDNHMAELKSRHRRAYEPWTPEEEERLSRLIDAGETVAQIAGRLERNDGAIQARIVHLGLEDRLPPAELNRLRRTTNRTLS